MKTFKIIFIIVVLTIISAAALNAQVTIGADQAPENFSVLQIESNQQGGLRLPQMSTVKREMMSNNAAFKQNAKAEGLQIFNTDTKCIDTWNGTKWISECGTAGSKVTADNGLAKTADNIQLGGALTQNTEIAQDGKNLYSTGSGKISVGAAPTANSAKFEVNGASANTQSYSTNGMNIDFTQSNLAYTTASAGAFTLSGLKDGGTYTLAVKGTASGTASFSQSGLTFRIVNNGANTAGKHTLYTFVVMGSDAYVWMTKGF